VSMVWLEPVRAEFAERLKSGRLAHALLLSGPAGTGKLDFAREMAGGLLCLEGSMPGCGGCRSCQLLSTGAHPDFRLLGLELNDKGNLRSEIVIEQIRNLISALQLTTTISARKVALLHPAEAMNRNAANALLKTLEEPPGETVLILVSHDPGRLPVTIRSRCQALQLRMPHSSALMDWLRDVSGCDAATAESALNASAGSPLRARDMLADGSTAHYSLVSRTLDELLDKSSSSSQAMAALADAQADIEPEQLWTWLSLCAADKIRQKTGANEYTKTLSQLQAQADRNRALLSTQVRKDLLLQDWLIQWARLKV
jgi:DNA polymerase-3 subunit delta'